MHHGPVMCAVDSCCEAGDVVLQRQRGVEGVPPLAANFDAADGTAAVHSRCKVSANQTGCRQIFLVKIWHQQTPYHAVHASRSPI